MRQRPDRPRYLPRARRLVGIDIEPEMVAAALRTGQYEAVHLHDARIGTHLIDADLVVSAGVMLYFAPDEFAQVLGFCHTNLVDGGRLAFLMEVCSDQCGAIGNQGRWALSFARISSLAAESGFEVEHSGFRCALGLTGFFVLRKLG